MGKKQEKKTIKKLPTKIILTYYLGSKTIKKGIKCVYVSGQIQKLFTSLADKTQEKIDEIFERFKKTSHKAQVAFLDEINKEFLNFLTEENNGGDATDGTSNFLSRILESIQEKFDDFLNIHRNKKDL